MTTEAEDPIAEARRLLADGRERKWRWVTVPTDALAALCDRITELELRNRYLEGESLPPAMGNLGGTGKGPVGW